MFESFQAGFGVSKFATGSLAKHPIMFFVCSFTQGRKAAPHPKKGGKQHQRRRGGVNTSTRKRREGKQHQPKQGEGCAASFGWCCNSLPLPFLYVAAFPPRSPGRRCWYLLSPSGLRCFHPLCGVAFPPLLLGWHCFPPPPSSQKKKYLCAGGRGEGEQHQPKQGEGGRQPSLGGAVVSFLLPSWMLLLSHLVLLGGAVAPVSPSRVRCFPLLRGVAFPPLLLCLRPS